MYIKNYQGTVFNIINLFTKKEEFMKYANVLFVAGLFVMFCQIGAMEEGPDGRYPYVYGSSESEYEQQDIYDKARAREIEKEKRRAQIEKQRQAIMRGETSTSYPTMSGEDSTYIAPSKRRTGDATITEKSGLRRPMQPVQREKKY